MKRSRRAPDRHARARHPRSRRSRTVQFLATGTATGRLPAFLLSVGLAVFAYAFLLSGDFTVRTVEVRGNDLAFAGAIGAMSGAMQQPIFRLDTEAVAARVAAHPAVASADVVLEFPDRAIVTVRERVPVLVWQGVEQSVTVDERGWAIAAGDDPSLPHVVQFQGTPPEVGTQLPAKLVAAAILAHTRLQPRLETLEYQVEVGLTAHLQDGRAVVLGSASRMPVKLNVLEAALSIGERWTQLDLREPERPYYQ